MASLDPTRTWLRYCDCQISQPEGVDFLKLGLFSEFASKFNKLDELQYSSEVYDLLCECCRESGSQLHPLQIFVHVLRKMGRKLRGKWVVKHLSQYGVEDYKSLSCTEVSKEFLFFQSLVRVASQLRTTETENRMISHFSRPSRLNVRPDNVVRNLPHMFMLLYQRGFISWENTSALEVSLRKYNAARSLDELYEYQKSVGLISDYEPNYSGGELSDSLTGPSSVYTSDAGDQNYRRRMANAKGRKKSSTSTTQQSSHEQQPHTVNESPGNIASQKGLFTNSSSDDSDSDNTAESKPLLGQRKRGLSKSTSSAGSVETQHTNYKNAGRKAGRCCIFMLWSSTAVLITAMLGIMLALVWWNVIIPHKSQDIKVYEGHTIVLCEMNQFYQQSLNLHEKVDIQNSWFETEIFVLSFSCQNLQAYTSFRKTEGVNTTANNSWYLLPGSKLNYDFAVSSNSSIVNERIHVYLVRGIMYPDDFNPKLDQDPKTVVVHKETIAVGRSNTQKTSRFSFNATEWDYYSLFVFLPEYHTVHYSFNFTVEQRMINLSFVKSNNEQNCSLTDDEDTCNVTSKHFQRGKACIIASVKNDSDSRFTKTHINVQVQLWLRRVLVSTALPVVIVIAVLLVILVFLTYWCCCRARNTQPQEELMTTL